MFLTERQGGSDVGANTTRAVQDGDEWRLFGDKHFCSNVDAEVFIVLARPEGAPGGQPRPRPPSSSPAILPDGSPNGFTHQAAQAEARHRGRPDRRGALDGARAWLAGGPRLAGGRRAGPTPDAARDGRGINRMMEMVNGSRFGVALMGLASTAARSSRPPSTRPGARQFGNRIDSYPLVRETLVDLLVDLEAGMAATYECAARRARRPGPRGGPPPAPHPHPAGQDALHPDGAVGGVDAASRSSAATATWRTGPWPASCATPSATPSGRAPRTSSASTSAGPCGASRPTWPCWPGSSGRSRRRSGHKVAGRRARHRRPASLPTPGRRSPTWRGARRPGAAPAAGGSPSSWPTPSEGALLVEEAAWALDRDGDARKAAVARRSPPGAWPTPPLRGITDPDRIGARPVRAARALRADRGVRPRPPEPPSGLVDAGT